MKKNYVSMMALALFMPVSLFAQRVALFNEAQFFVGSGANTALFIADFNNQNGNECLVWGYRFDGSLSAEQMLHDIDSVDPRLSVGMSGGFLSDLSFLNYSGLGGQPNYWGSFTYDADSLKWDMNMGLSEVLSDSSIFGISYTPWDANYNPIYVPEDPTAVYAPTAIELPSAMYSVGSGSNIAFLIADFNNGSAMESIILGYRFDGTATAEQMLHDIDSIDSRFTINAPGGFLSDFSFLSNAGIGGQPNYWASFTYDADSLKWDMNMGLSEVLSDSSIFGISYTPWDANYNPIYVPEDPTAVYAPTAIELPSAMYSVGSGSNIAFLIADFNNGSAMESIILGYRFDGTATAEQMLHDIDSIDSRFTINAPGGFLSDFSFLSNAGIGGQPNYWASFTYDADSLKWDMNMGLSEVLSDSSIFGISYTPWDANYNPIYVPEDPTAVYAPTAIELPSAMYSVGSGSNIAFLIADFNNGSAMESIILGYRFDGTATAEQMLHDIDSIDSRFTINAPGGFISDFSFLSNAGIGGQPNYWASFTYDADSLKWDMNMGLSEVLSDSSIFGISYTPWDANNNPIYVPENPSPIIDNTYITESSFLQSNVFPNPCSDQLSVTIKGEQVRCIVYSLDGKSVFSTDLTDGVNFLNTSQLLPGIYNLFIFNEAQSESIKIQKL